MAINLEQAMKDIYGDSYKTTTNTTNKSYNSTLPVKQSTVSQPKTNTKTTGTITLASAFNDIYGDDTAYDTYVSNKAIYQPAITDDENLQKKDGFWKNIFQTSKYYQDGYDKGDFLRTVGDTGKSALSSIAEGFLNTVEGIADWGQYRVSDVLDFFGATNAAQSVKENAQFNSTASIFGKNTTGGDLFESGWKENLDKGSVLGRSGQQIFEGIGNVAALAGSAYLGGQAIGGIAPAATTTTFGQSTLAEIGASSVGSYVSAYGSARSNALNQGYSDADAKKAAVVSGLAEAISEQFFNGMTGLHTAGLGETVFGKVVPKTVTESMQKFFSTKAGKVVSVILDGVEEGSEEIISNILTATGNDIAHLIDPNYSANGMDEQTGNWWKDVRAQLVSSESWDAFFSAMMTSALLGGANTMINGDNKPLLNSQQRQELIQAYAEDNNISVEEAKGHLDLQESVQGKDDKTIERTIYSNVDTSMTLEQINQIETIEDLNDLHTQLREDLIGMTNNQFTRSVNQTNKESLDAITERLNAVEARQKELIEKMTPTEQGDTLNKSIEEMSNIIEQENPSPEVMMAKDSEIEDTVKAIDDETSIIPVAENKKDVRLNYNQVEQSAIEYINQLNEQREAQGQPRITIIQNLTQEQTRIADALMALGRHVMFAKDLPGSFVTPSVSGDTALNQVLYISDKINTGLLAKSNVTNKNQAMTYAVGHELFHSLKMTEPNVYDNFVVYVANTINNDQIIEFMEMYDPQDTQELLKSLQEGNVNLEEILSNPKKYGTQYQALLNIAEEMTANEFGGMLTDVDYMTKLANENQSLFKKLVTAIKKFFKDLDKPIYNSPLTQLQINTVRQNFEDIVKNVDNSLSTTQGLMNEINATTKNVANSQETVYNTPQKEEGYNEFERLQRESEGLSNEEKQLYRSGSREIDDALRGRLSNIFERKLESSRSGDSNDARVLKDPVSGNSFDVYENVDAQTFHDIFEIVQRYTKNGELVDVHPAVTNEDSIGYNETRNYMSKDGLSGFAITPDGDLISVFNASDKRGWLRAIADTVKSEAKTLDCYVSPRQNLQEMYQRMFGFQTASIMNYNMKYDHDDIAKNHNKPKVAFMVNTNQDVQTRSFGKDDYDEAKAYQMSFFDENASEKTSFADVATAYNDANSGKISVEDARAVYNRYLDEGGKQDVDIETALDGLENSVKKPKPTRQKLEKVTQQVNTSERVENPARQKLPTKQTRTPNYIEHFDENMREGRSDAYLVFEDTILDDKLSGKNIETLREHALEAAKDEETKDLIRNWTPEIMEQERAEIKATEQTRKDIVKENNNKIKLNDKYYEAKSAYESLLESGLDGFRTKARKLYKEYKDAGGKRIIEGLEETKSQEKPSLPKKELNINEEVKTTQMSLEDRFKMLNRQYEKYQKATGIDKQRILNALLNSYNGYKKGGGTELIEELEKMPIEQQSKVRENVLRDMAERSYMNSQGDIKMLPTTTEEFDVDKYRTSEERERYNEQLKAEGLTESKFFNNTVFKSPILRNLVSRLKNDSTFTHYIKTTNTQLVNEALDRLESKGVDNEFDRLMAKRTGGELFNASELPEAAMLIAYYNEEGKNQTRADSLAGQLTQSVSGTGLTLQAVKTIQNLDPNVRTRVIEHQFEQSIRNLAKNGSEQQKQWAKKEIARIERTGSALTEGQKRYITEMYKEAKKYDDNSYEKDTIEKLVDRYLQNEIPHSWSRKAKDFRRLMMLANPKTWGRNDFANAFAILPNIVGKGIAAKIDAKLSKKYGTSRTTGDVDVESLKLAAKGFKEGAKRNVQDLKLGINNENIMPDDTWFGRTINKINRFTRFAMGVDKAYESAYIAFDEHLTERSGNNQVSDITRQTAAEEYAKQNIYTRRGKTAQTVQKITDALNQVHIGEFGLGDMVAPFVRTPANLAAAVYYYSPAAQATAYKQSKALKEAIENGADANTIFTLQHNLADTIGRSVAGTLLYVLAGTLAAAGITTGDEDDDKDVAAALAAQGWQKYSIKLSDNTYISYDWVEPFSMPFAVMSDLVNKKDANVLDTIVSAINISGTRLQEQSFLYGLHTLFSADNPVEGAVDVVTQLPASFVPTALKQLADVIDPTAKSTYDSNSALQTMINQVAVKIPGVKSLLPTKKTTLGESAIKYTENKDVMSAAWNAIQSIFLPGNINTASEKSYIANEFLDVYNHTGDSTIMPQNVQRTYNYDSDNDGKTEKYTLSLNEKNKLQEKAGQIASESMKQLMLNDIYNNATYQEKATALTSLVQYAKSKALEESGYVPNYQIKSGNAAQINKFTKAGLSVGEAVMFDSLITGIKANRNADGTTVGGSESGKKAYAIMNMAVSDDAKNIMLYQMNTNQKSPETVDRLKDLVTQEDFINYYSLPVHDAFVNDKFSRDDLNIAKDYFKFDVSDFATYANELSEIRSDKDANGNTISNSKKRKVTEYLNSLPLNPIQKTYLYGVSGYSIKPYKNELYNYINGLDISAEEKQQLWKNLGF